jgi:hypothetical protein
MEILELVSSEAEDNGSLHSKTDFMNLRNLRPSAKLRERLITNQANHSAIDNLVRALVDLLPKPDGVWPLEERANGSASPPVFLILATKRVMENACRSASRPSNAKPPARTS